jgi:multidrug efflux pump subunit AcrA (membrane-fusion protein)
MQWSRRVWIGLAGVGVVAAGAWFFSRGQTPTLTTAEVVRGEFVDVVEIRGQVRPLKSIVVTAPTQSGELQILKIAPNGSPIAEGDVAIEFDGSALQRTIIEKQAELKQALAELEQVKARASIGVGNNQMSLLTTKYDVERARLDTAPPPELVSKADAKKAALALADAEKRADQARVKDTADTRSNETGYSAQNKKIAKIEADLTRAQVGLEHLKVTAPASGVINILPNWRNNSGMGSPAEYRPGDSAYPGAEILELPDLSSVHLEAKLDESDRGRLKVGQRATIRVDAIADHEYQAAVSDVSMLAKVDFSSWPATKNFALMLAFDTADARLRPGMSAAARITVGSLPDMLIVPSEAVFIVDGRPSVFVLRGRKFETLPIDIVKRGREQVAVKTGLQAGDRVALTRPDVSGSGSAK